MGDDEGSHHHRRLGLALPAHSQEEVPFDVRCSRLGGEGRELIERRKSEDLESLDALDEGKKEGGGGGS